MSSRESTQKEEKRLEIWPFPHAPKWKVSKTMPWVKIMPSVINYLYYAHVVNLYETLD